MSRTARKIADKLTDIVDEIKSEEADRFTEIIKEARRVFIIGMGRSGLAGKAFAMRLMHCGKKVFVVGETITPAIMRDDVLVAISGSGKTSSVVSICETAKKNGAGLALISSSRDSLAANLADHVVQIRGRTKTEKGTEFNYDSRQIEGSQIELTPMGTLFELSTMIFLDSIIAKLMKEINIDEKFMKSKHTNLE